MAGDGTLVGSKVDSITSETFKTESMIVNGFSAMEVDRNDEETVYQHGKCLGEFHGNVSFSPKNKNVNSASE